MTENGRDRLTQWCRFVKIDDSDEDGIGSFIMKFKIRNENMTMWMSSLTYDDACKIAESIIKTTVLGCEGFADDWMDPSSGFAINCRLENGFIVIEGNYRT